MTVLAQTVLEQALALTEEDRRRVAQALLDSLPPEPDRESQEAWRDVVVQRMAEVQRGEVALEPWSEVEAHIQRALDRAR